MATKAQFNAKSPTIKRILREASELSNSPSPDYTAIPIDDNLFEWHFTLRGPPGSSPTTTSIPADKNSTPEIGGPYHDGIYHGRIVLPAEYPLRPPSFRFLTPSGRFETNREICLSISGHHEETWQPAWGLRTALVALRTFMETDAKGQLGGIECSDTIRRRMAQESRNWKCPSCAKSNHEILKECEEASSSSSSSSSITKSKAEEIEIPKELNLRYKDDLERERNSSDNGVEIARKEIDEELNELAEGFVQTVPIAASGSPPRPVPVQRYPAARPGQGVSRSTGSATLVGGGPAQVQRHRQHSNAGVPGWVDKAIVGISACLVVMILKVLLGL